MKTTEQIQAELDVLGIMKQLNINPDMDRLARDNGLGHWSCVSPLSCHFWLRSDGLNIKLLDNNCPIIENLEWYDINEPIGKDWQQPETEEDFLSRKLPCDIKIGCGVNKAGTSIRTLLLRANSVTESKNIIIRDNADDVIQDMLVTGTGVHKTDKEKYHEIMSSIIHDAVNKQPTLVQKPFQYPCDGALYFTRDSHEQVFLTGHIGDNLTPLVGKLKGSKAGEFSYWSFQFGIAYNRDSDGGFFDGNPANDLIMMVWE